MPNLHQLLKAMVEKGSSDLHITTGSPPQLRIDGSLVPLKTPPLTPVETKQLCYSILADAQKHKFEEENELDLSFGVKTEEIGTFQVFEPGGCRTCNDRGYKGRVALYEVMPLWDSLKELVINGASTAELKAEAIRLGMQTLRMAAIGKLKSGMTSIEEVVGNTAPDTMR